MCTSGTRWVVGVVAILATACLDGQDGPEPEASTGGTTEGAATTHADALGDDDTAAPIVSTSDASTDGPATTDTGAPMLEICDGSDALRLVARTGAPESSCPEGGLTMTGLYTMLGDTYLYVRGDCRYWVIGPPFGFLGSARTGTLDPAQANALAEDIGYAQWPELHGRYDGGSADCYRTLASPGSTIECGGSCYWGSWAPAEIRMWLDAARSWQTTLTEDGQPVPLGDPLRLDGWIVDAEPAQPLDDIVEWPFPFTPEEAGIPPYAPSREATWLVTDPEITAAFRSYWTSFDGPTPDHVWPFSFSVPGDPVRIVSLWLRDVVPFEDADGYIPIADPPVVPAPD